MKANTHERMGSIKPQEKKRQAIRELHTKSLKTKTTKWQESPYIYQY
jgi:hypothetical protein